MNIEIVRESPDKLRRSVWVFNFHQGWHDATYSVSVYGTAERPSLRHKWKLSGGQYRSQRPGNSIPRIMAADVPLPVDVTDEAVKEFLMRLEFVEPKDYK